MFDENGFLLRFILIYGCLRVDIEETMVPWWEWHWTAIENIFSPRNTNGDQLAWPPVYRVFHWILQTGTSQS